MRESRIPVSISEIPYRISRREKLEQFLCDLVGCLACWHQEEDTARRLSLGDEILDRISDDDSVAYLGLKCGDFFDGAIPDDDGCIF